MLPAAARTTTVPPPPFQEEDAFRYGYRLVRRELPGGGEEWDQVPLTLEDVLHPQEGDVIPLSPLHQRELEYLAPVLRSRLPESEGWLILVDCLVHWGVRGIRNHSPDLTVYADVAKPPPLAICTFRLRRSGGRCVLALELVSPDSRANDVEAKFREYYQVGVPFYVLVDQEREGSPRRLRGYQYTRRGYRAVPLDEHGRLRLKQAGVSLGLREERLVCFDAQTGEELGDYQQVLQAAETATAARKAAEKQARKAEKQAREAKQRIRELEAEMRRLRGGSPSEAGE